jgi:hypothetical protein
MRKGIPTNRVLSFQLSLTMKLAFRMVLTIALLLTKGISTEIFLPIMKTHKKVPYFEVNIGSPNASKTFLIPSFKSSLIELNCQNTEQFMYRIEDSQSAMVLDEPLGLYLDRFNIGGETLHLDFRCVNDPDKQTWSDGVDGYAHLGNVLTAANSSERNIVD